jgi:hypothetical protein
MMWVFLDKLCLMSEKHRKTILESLSLENIFSKIWENLEKRETHESKKWKKFAKLTHVTLEVLEGLHLE